VQTLFTCLYCQRPAAIKNKVLKVFCHGVLKTCEINKRAASQASVYEVFLCFANRHASAYRNALHSHNTRVVGEQFKHSHIFKSAQEEDLSTSTGGFALCEEMTEEQVSASLASVEDELQQQIKDLRARGDGGGATTSNQTMAADREEGEEEEGEGLWQQLEGLLARIRLRRGWFAVTCHLSKGFKSIRAARKSIAYSRTQLALVRKSVSLYHDLSATPAHAPANAHAETETPHNYAFQPQLNLKHMAPSPPRAVRLLSIDEALQEVEVVLQQLDSLCVRLPLITNLQQLQHVLADFAADIHPLPGAMPRSFLRIMLWSDNKILGSQVTCVSVCLLIKCERERAREREKMREKEREREMGREREYLNIVRCIRGQMCWTLLER